MTTTRREYIKKSAVGIAAISIGGHNSALFFQLGKISQRIGRSLKINPQNGHVLHDHEASKFWSREYEKGWEMTL